MVRLTHTHTGRQACYASHTHTLVDRHGMAWHRKTSCLTIRIFLLSLSAYSCCLLSLAASLSAYSCCLLLSRHLGCCALPLAGACSRQQHNGGGRGAQNEKERGKREGGGKEKRGRKGDRVGGGHSWMEEVVMDGEGADLCQQQGGGSQQRSRVESCLLESAREMMPRTRRTWARLSLRHPTAPRTHALMRHTHTTQRVERGSRRVLLVKKSAAGESGEVAGGMSASLTH